ncbi:hypothetical protein PR048_019105 [Dryococelus australis]|uniref:Uncharacterized protein n=1 Tax=Dryococelus australis TaxID=614101 RepID=A0ABQ9H2N4_9NEOP|nr:hypothetical protein PR048_019105 [Dryococelus australis]
MRIELSHPWRCVYMIRVDKVDVYSLPQICSRLYDNHARLSHASQGEGGGEEMHCCRVCIWKGDTNGAYASQEHGKRSARCCRHVVFLGVFPIPNRRRAPLPLCFRAVCIAIVLPLGKSEGMEQRRNERAGETGDPRENLPTSGIVRHDSHMRISEGSRLGIEPGSPWWEASRLTAQSPRHHQCLENVSAVCCYVYAIFKNAYKIIREKVRNYHADMKDVQRTRGEENSKVYGSGACGKVLQTKLVLAQCCTLSCTQQEPVATVQPRESECIPTTHKRAARDPLHTSCGVSCRDTSDGGEMSRERSTAGIKGWGETGDLRENPARVPLAEIQELTQSGIEAGSPGWETSRPTRLQLRYVSFPYFFYILSGKPHRLLPYVIAKENNFKDKTDFKRAYTGAIYAIGSEFIRHALDDSAPTANLQADKKLIPYCQRWGNTGATANEQTSERDIGAEGVLEGSEIHPMYEQEPVTRVEPGETECTAATHERVAVRPLHACCDIECTTAFKWPMCKLAKRLGTAQSKTQLTLKQFTTHSCSFFESRKLHDGRLRKSHVILYVLYDFPLIHSQLVKVTLIGRADSYSMAPVDAPLRAVAQDDRQSILTRDHAPSNPQPILWTCPRAASPKITIARLGPVSVIGDTFQMKGIFWPALYTTRKKWPVLNVFLSRGRGISGKAWFGRCGASKFDKTSDTVMTVHSTVCHEKNH